MMDCIGYSKSEVKRGNKLANVAKMPCVWIDLEAPKPNELEEIQKKYKLHPLNIEDCMNVCGRPKMDVFDNYLFLTFKAFDYNKKEKIHVKHIGIFLGNEFLITVHPEHFYEMDKIKKALEQKQKHLLENSIDFLLYFVLDMIVDDYLTIIDSIEDELERLENLAMGLPSKHVVQKIFKMKKVNIAIRKVLWPEREIVTSLEKGSTQFISKKNSVYFRDVHDHLFQMIDINEGYRDIITGILDIYLSSVSNSLNEVMKTLTVISALVLVPTLIAGIYGMNFHYMPEISWEMGYAWALSLMVGSIVIMYLWFKQKKWI